MKHWIVNSQREMLGNWKEAFPRAKLLAVNAMEALSVPADGMLWVRVRSEIDFSLLSDVLQSQSGAKVVVLADNPDESVVMRSLELGALGCCNTHAAVEVLRQVALVVSHGGLWIGQSLLQQLLGSTSRSLSSLATRPPRADWGKLLSEREVEVARLVAGGSSNKEIANLLSVTERTIKAHLTAIFEKLGLRDRLQLSLRVNGVKL